MTVVERFVDLTVSWLTGFRVRGAGHVYDGLLRPLVARHEDDIDRASWS